MSGTRRSQTRILFVIITILAIPLGLTFLWPLAFPSYADASPNTAISFASPQICPPWQTVAIPNPSVGDNELNDIAAINANDIWAVGFYNDSSDYAHTLTLHWDGVRWTVVPSPDPEQRNYLTAVTAISADDVWAVGTSDPADSPPKTLTMHWDSASWNIVPSPNPGDLGHENLLDVTAISAKDVWAVGYYYQANGFSQTLAMHWDGQSWNVTPTPNPGGDNDNNTLHGISAISANDIWAVGRYGDHNPTMMLHWDGSQWSLVPSPDPAPDYGWEMYGVSAIATDDVWAVGYGGGPTGPEVTTVTLHWNGATWSRIDSPNFDPHINYLYSVAGTASNDVWAVGWSGSQLQTLHWDGIQWSGVASQSVGTFENRFYGITALDANNVWAVGNCIPCYDSGDRYRGIIEHYLGPCGTATPIPTETATATATPPLPSPTATNTRVTTTSVPTYTSTTTATATVTQIVATISATSIPTFTPCSINFTDVPMGSTFYSYIKCLVCQGIVSGYADGTFQPGEDVTRGQLSKIVAKAAGFNEAVTDWTFQDVPPNSTFYSYVERMASRNIISGYPCGGQGEPCMPPGNLPYFRPGRNATRGQISKIVSSAAQLGDPAGEQIFEDVPPSNPFYDWVQRLAHLGAMSGYRCGGPGEPCAPPLNRAYFRWSNNATRGQTAKIVTITFLPDCATP